MKRLILLVIILAVFGIIVFTLFSNRAEMVKKSRFNPNIAYPVSVAPVIKQKISEHLSQQGLIVAGNDVAVVSDLQIQGKVTAIMVKEGAYVAAGTPILKIEDEVPEANFLNAQTNYKKAQKDWERSVELHQEGLISDAELESAHQAFQAAEAQYVSAQRQYKHSTITSPIPGIVTSLPVNLGSMVSPGMIVANVVDISTLKVKLNLGEQDVFKLKVGDQAEVTTDVYPGVKFFGRIDTIGVKADEAHTYPVQISIPNRQAYQLKSGMFGRVTFNFASREALTIPRNALVGGIENPQVFVVKAGKAKLRDIQVGPEVDTNIVVLQGLNEGEQIVTSGQDNLKDNSAVVVAGSNPAPNYGNGRSYPGSKGKEAYRKGYRRQQ